MADFVSGIFHWLEDTYLTEETDNKFIAHIAKHNKIHHTDPTAFTKDSWFVNIQTTIPVVVSGLVLGYMYVLVQDYIPFIPELNFFWYTMMGIMLIFTNLIHRWAHVPNPPDFAHNMHSIGVFQTMKHHRKHHILAAKFDEDGDPVPGSHYCIIGNILNPVLESVNFWRYLEFVVYKVSGIKPLHKHNMIK